MSDVTIKDIAAAAGVSHPTVSKALNHQPGVGEETRRKILELARQMNYVPNIAAKRLANRKNRSIGFVWPNADGLFFFHVCKTLQKEALRRKIDVVFTMTEPENALRMFREFFIDFALLWSGPAWIPSAEFTAARQRLGGELVIAGGGYAEGAHIASIDRAGGIYNAMKYLASLGHRRIAFLGEESQKSMGYLKYMLEGGLEYHADYFMNVSSTFYRGMRENREELVNKFTRLWQSPLRPTALILDSQDIAFGFLSVLNTLKISVPADLSLICYDDVPELSVYQVPLTTCGPNTGKLVENILSLFEDCYSGNAPNPPARRSFVPELVVRESTKPV